MNDLVRADALAVRPYRREDAAAWDAFVRAHAEGTFFHLSGWRTVLARAFAHPAHYLLAAAGDRIQGILPLAHVRSHLFGSALISLPFCSYGGVLASNDAAARALEQAAADLATELQVDYLEMRNRRRVRVDWPSKDLYVTFRRPICGDHDANLRAIPRKQRAMVRKGIERGLRAELDPSCDRLYAAYSESLRNLGTPIFAKRYLRILMEEFKDCCEVLSVVADGEPVASVMSFYFRDEVLPYYGGGTARARELAANDFMYWSVMQRAADRGVRCFDYGRSKHGTGSFSFKANWGFEPQPLSYEYHLVRSGTIPNLSPTNPKYQLMIRAWRRLPLWLTHIIGPPLARSLG
jgi:FemAB-related protein (PEP-CTERM system-associated)